MSSLSERLHALMAAADYVPQDAVELAQSLHLGTDERRELKQLLQQEFAGGLLRKVGKRAFALCLTAEDAVTGRVQQRGRDRLFFLPDAASLHLMRRYGAEDGDVYPLTEFNARGAMDGDRVRVRVHARPQRPKRSNKRRPAPEGAFLSVRVEEILSRGHNKWVGIYQSGGSRYGILAGDGKTAPERVVLTTPPPPELLPFMRIVAEPQTYPAGNQCATARLLEVLGWPTDAGVQVTTIMHQYELPDRFDETVAAESERIPDAVSDADCAGRDNWCDRCVLTIDPESARDYDDAVSVRATDNGYELAVHIADVSHYVRPGSALDAEAQRRGNSTYLPDRVLPMLPPRLCDGICSLRQGERRLTRLCLLHINRQGKVIRAAFRNAVICSRRRLTYAQALDVLQGKGSTGDAETDAMLLTAHKLSTLLRKRRMAAGALNLDMPEIRIVTNDRGVPCDIELTEADEAHSLIEEFMLAANEAVAAALNAQGIPALYRIHEAPDPAKLREFSLLLKSSGIQAGTLETRGELIRVMEQIEQHADAPLLKVALLRTMMRARYSPKALGHYGLAKGDYCHFTSPIRRYADLVVHRAFDRLTDMPAADYTPLPRMGALDGIAEHISETERTSAAAETAAQQALMGLFMREQCEAEHPRVWDASVTACWAQGLAVEIPLLKVKGFVSAATLPEQGHERWFFERHTQRWSSTAARVLMPGSKLRVIPVNVDLSTGFVDFQPQE